MSKKNFSENGNFIFIDIGSHSCGEIKSLSDSKFFFYKLTKRIIRNIYKKNSLNIGFFKNLVINHFKIKSLAKKMTLILIEPNYLHFNEKIYKLSSMVLPAAIKKDKENVSRTTKLFYANNDPKSAGNSIFSHKSNIDENHFKNVLNLSTRELYDILKNTFLHKNSKVIIRVNCEGLEDEIIYDFKKFIPKKLIGIMGSIKDVKSIIGNEEYYNLVAYIKQEKINFIPFSDDIDTWGKAHAYIYSLLRNL